jgi:hypothetical protein
MRNFSSSCWVLAASLATSSMVGCGDDTGGGTGSGGSGSTGSESTSGTGSTGTGDAGNDLFEATVDGSPGGHSGLSIPVFPGGYAERRDTPNGERISVHANVPGTSPDFMVGEQSLRIYLEPFDGPREYVFGEADGAGAAYAEQDDTFVFYAAYGEPYLEHGSGSITITSRTDARLAGSFSFVAEDDQQAASVTIEGTFDLPLQADGG